MLRKLANFAREHILATAATAAVAGASAAWPVFLSIYEAKVNRVEAMKVAEFQSLMTERNKFFELLAGFTEEVATSGTVDQGKKKEISAILVRLYNGYGTFMVNIPQQSEIPVRELQSSLNELRKRVQTFNRKADLDPLAVAFIDVDRSLKKVQPIIENAVGKSASPGA